MSLPPLDQTLPTDSLRITSLDDPVIDLLGHDLRSTYVERFWLPILGPTTTFFLRHVAVELEAHPDGFDLHLLDTAGALGLGGRTGRNAPFLRAIDRTRSFKLSQPAGPGALAVRRRIPPLTRVQIERLPVPLRDEHASWQKAAERSPTPDQQRSRARRLALSLVELGEDDEQVEHQLHRWQVHPALAHEALRWARLRTRGGPVPAGAVPGAPPTPPAPIPPPRPVAVFDPAGDAA